MVEYLCFLHVRRDGVTDDKMTNQDGTEDGKIVKAATKLVAMSLATGFIDFYEESIENDQRTEYRKLIEKARKIARTASEKDNLDIYECVNSVHSILRDSSYDTDSINTCTLSSKSSTCKLL